MKQQSKMKYVSRVFFSCTVFWHLFLHHYRFAHIFAVKRDWKNKQELKKSASILNRSQKRTVLVPTMLLIVRNALICFLSRRFLTFNVNCGGNNNNNNNTFPIRPRWKHPPPFHVRTTILSERVLLPLTAGKEGSGAPFKGFVDGERGICISHLLRDKSLGWLSKRIELLHNGRSVSSTLGVVPATVDSGYYTAKSCHGIYL